MSATMVEPNRYRVELWQDGRCRVMAYLPDGAPHHSSLTVVATRLQLDGRGRGILGLIEEETGRVVARRFLGRERRRAASAGQRGA